MQISVVRKRITWLLNAAAVLLVVVLVSVCLGLILYEAGDTSGGEAVRGLTYVALTVFAIDVLTLLGHLTLAVLILLDRTDSVEQPVGEISDSDLKSSS